MIKKKLKDKIKILRKSTDFTLNIKIEEQDIDHSHFINREMRNISHGKRI
jgi:hypothetical protein|tara:strand:- start:16721 stop:16870 length:150 start_codon:yes stop_codon:yes gene_type:complete